jgi:hypothetical protein
MRIHRDRPVRTHASVLVAVLVVALAGCGKHKTTAAAGPEPVEIIPTVKSMGDRACACNGDKNCVKPIRDEWEAAKRDLLARSAELTGANKASWDKELMQLRACADGAGVTIWVDH